MATEYIIRNNDTRIQVAFCETAMPDAADMSFFNLDTTNGDTISIVRVDYELYEDLTGLKNPSCNIKVQRRRNITETTVETRVFGWSKKLGFYWR